MEQSKTHFNKTLAYVLLSGLFTLIISGWAGQTLVESGIFSIKYHEIVKGILFSGMLIPLLLVIHKYVYQNKPLGIWGSRVLIFKHFFKGVLLVLIPLCFSLTISYLTGWSVLAFHFNSSILASLSIGVIGIFIYQALPEELLIRGYIYGLIATKKGKLLSATLTVLIFVLIPVISQLVQTKLLGMTSNIGGSSTIQPGYIITLVIFASFMIFLRINTGSIWITMGFHLMFVFMNHLISPTSNSLIEIMEGTNEKATQITLIINFLLMVTYVVWKAYQEKQKVMQEVVFTSTP